MRIIGGSSTEQGTTIHYADGTVEQYVDGTLIINSDGDVLNDDTVPTNLQLLRQRQAEVKQLQQLMQPAPGYSI